ncbi:MAG: acyltransferase [Nitrospira sp.]|nr:acyltransferase [Nitrospira sp.]
MTFDKETPFPSLYTLAPTMGAALIILFARPGTMVGRLLSGRVPVAVGLVSYSAYLWHQPLFAFARHRSLTELNSVVLASLVAVTFVLAYVTWRYVETPFRQKSRVSKGVLWRSAVTSAVVLATFAAGLQATAGTFQSRITSDAQKLFRAFTCMFEQDQTYHTLLIHHCDQPSASIGPEGAGPPRPSTRYILYGDSIAAHLYPGLLSRIPESDIIQLTGGACRAMRSIDTPRCRDFYDWFVGEYVPNKMTTTDVVLVSSSWLSDYTRLGDHNFRVKLNELFERLQGRRVLVFSMAASLKADIPRYHYKLAKFGYGVPALLEMDDGTAWTTRCMTHERAMSRALAEEFGDQVLSPP